MAPRYCILKAFQCIFRKKANVSLVQKMSPNFQGCRDICPHVLATLAEHWIQGPRALLLAHLSRRLMGSLLYTSHSGVRLLSVCPEFQTSSLKPLGQLNSNFIWRLLWTQERSLFKWSWSHDQDGRRAHIW